MKRAIQTHSLTMVPSHHEPTRMLEQDLDDAVQALATFDADRLEAMEGRIRTLTSVQLAGARSALPKLLEKHTQLGQMVDATAANLKVLVSVLNLQTRMEMK